MATQLSLLGGAPAPSFDPALPGLRRIELGAGAWIEIGAGIVRGHEALFAELGALPGWRSERRHMYEREVAVPRLTRRLDPGEAPPVVRNLGASLARHTGVALPHLSMALYRDGADSVAWHGDKVLRDQPESVMAIVSLGQPRRFLLRPAGGGRSRRFHFGWGDLLVLGGTVQRTFEHCVPKLRSAGPRLSLMYRPELI